MTKVARYVKAASAAGALEAKRADPSAAYLAGGTYVLAGDGRDKPESVIDLAAALPRGLIRDGAVLTIGAGTTFREMAESKDAPRCIVEAALTMVNRNTRNRGTLGGNLGADKSCSSMLPILIALEAEVEVVSTSSPAPRRVELEAWLRGREPGLGATPAVSAKTDSSDLLLRVLVPIKEGRRAAYRRWNRVSCDLSVLGAAAAYELEASPKGSPSGGAVRGLRIALGGLGPKARRFPALEALFQGRPLPSREEIEAAAAPLLKPIDDLRASAAFKRLRGAQLLADALIEAAP
jgi:CO/xanthine dehydrogenase FAD-binding subunit